MDLSDKIKREVTDLIEWAPDDGKLQPAAALRELLKRSNVLEVMAAAHDAEQSAQMGEPSPWRDDIGGNDPEWKSERRTAMLCALQAVGLA